MTQPEDPFGTPAEHPAPPSSPQPPAPGQPPAGQQPPPGYPPPAGYGQPPAGYGQPPAAYGQPPAGYGYPPAQVGAYASWIERVGGYLIDWLITGAPFLVLLLLGAVIGGGFGTFLVIVGYLAGLALGLWNYVFRQGTTGQTIGKQQLSMKLVRESDGQVLGPGMTFVRLLAHVLDGLACGLGYLWPLWDDKRQTFADKVCSTVVVKV